MNQTAYLLRAVHRCARAYYRADPTGNDHGVTCRSEWQALGNAVQQARRANLPLGMLGDVIESAGSMVDAEVRR